MIVATSMRLMGAISSRVVGARSSTLAVVEAAGDM